MGSIHKWPLKQRARYYSRSGYGELAKAVPRGIFKYTRYDCYGKNPISAKSSAWVEVV